MAYIGFNPSQLAIAPFATKLFAGDGTTTTFTLDQSVPGANEANVEVFVENVQQSPIDAYTIGGALNNQLIFSEAPSSGAAIYVIHKGEATYNLQPATGSVTAATLDPVLRNFTVDKFTGNGSTKTFTLSDTPYSPNSVLVMVDGIVQTSGTNYTVSGNTLNFDVAPTEAPDNTSNITVVHLGFSSGNKAVMDASISPIKLSPGGPSWTTNGNTVVSGLLGVGQPTPTEKIHVLDGKIAVQGDTTTPTTGHAFFYKQSYGVTLSGYQAVIETGSAGSRSGKMFVTFDGKVGIGTSTPAHVLSVSSPSEHGLYSQTRATPGGTTIGVGQEMFLRFADSANTPFVAGSIYAEARNGAASNGSSIPAGQGGGALELRAWSNGSLANRIRLEQSGAVNLPFGQIQFPATQNASSDPNTLDDYEEGTWTPVFQNADGSQSVSFTNAGTYTKIGRMVHCQVNVYNSSISAISAGNHIYLRNLPFSAIYFAANSVFSQYPNTPISIVDGAGTQAPLYAPTNAIDYTPFTRNSWGGAGTVTFRGQFSYQT